MPKTTADLVVVCSTKSTHQPDEVGIHHHIIGVGRTTPTGPTERLAVAQVSEMVQEDRIFTTISPSTSKVAGVEVGTCCGWPTLRSVGDVVPKRPRHDAELPLTE